MVWNVIHANLSYLRTFMLKTGPCWRICLDIDWMKPKLPTFHIQNEMFICTEPVCDDALWTDLCILCRPQSCTNHHVEFCPHIVAAAWPRYIFVVFTAGMNAIIKRYIECTAAPYITSAVSECRGSINSRICRSPNRKYSTRRRMTKTSIICDWSLHLV